MDRFAPDAVSIERVFAQSNRNTVLGTAQAAGLAMLAAAQRNIPVALHTPTEAKLAITGNGQAQKIQVERMVTRILNLTKSRLPPMPPMPWLWPFAMRCARQAHCRAANANNI